MCNNVARASIDNRLHLLPCFPPKFQIIATSNRDFLRPITDIAMSCATAALTSMPRVAPECSVNALATSVATVSVLQKVNMTNDIVALAKAYVNTGDALKTPDSPAARGEQTLRVC